MKFYKSDCESDIEMHEMLWLVHKTIYHDVTKEAVMRGSKEGFSLLPAHKTLFKVPKSKGLPIGNLTSQFFANVYMNGFDHYVKRRLKCKRYLRYVDDFVLFSDSNAELLMWHKEIVSYLDKELALQLRAPTILRSNSEGLDFLGYVIRPYYTLSRRRVVNNFKCKKARFYSAYEAQKGKIGRASCRERV